VVGCRVERLPLRDWQVDLDRAAEFLAGGDFDLFVLVNPNSPTGLLHTPARVKEFLRLVPECTLVWIDEAYADYAGITCEPLALEFPNVVVCKSMSKVYSLSGVRAAYALGSFEFVECLSLRTPPWVVSLPGQVAAVAALNDPAYYAARYAETRQLRADLDAELRMIGGETAKGETNFVLWFLPAAMDASLVADRCRKRGLFLREAASIGAGLENALRVSAKPREVQTKLLGILRDALDS
ncbi:MAG TPA: aminotransferase class I/II-fold pyridoxal phosphate-dependent enzyme, partial [Fimbriimonadaceae bacterium]|nr:aminotransferase class I/II-fold pyridoxal phosphate-dependent enzyme [Fimbriimonadaceae bacterium]